MTKEDLSTKSTSMPDVYLHNRYSGKARNFFKNLKAKNVKQCYWWNFCLQPGMIPQDQGPLNMHVKVSGMTAKANNCGFLEIPYNNLINLCFKIGCLIHNKRYASFF